MKTHSLILLRHAEAVPHGTMARDFDRPLTALGKEQAAAAGQALIEAGLNLENALVWCSSAQRTRQTAELALGKFPQATIQYVDALYDIDMSGLLEMLRETPDTTKTLVIVGHNPTIAETCHELAGDNLDAPQFSSLTQGYPPATATGYHIESDWTGLKTDTAELVYLKIV
ncbi:SixA phosphatase family protein [Kozakia baliensis]|uniref:Uncharacterized protein n=1 Tax=Kozakia baliensis TaxID=153496 RepID=A0A1D8US85_9PROT|nr:histidine phosphatase family protein [Kozakia baliensis]AOX16498.1 hypothetical protein A0U89_04460 [Kozakia baliensis]GBR29251.1 phosphohistidine phosphatase SixA [Kozakia baliensis NRIC 0488]GEL63405.1 phosphohistidine phosphatase [Kozakia baliensis]